MTPRQPVEVATSMQVPIPARQRGSAFGLSAGKNEKSRRSCFRPFSSVRRGFLFWWDSASSLSCLGTKAPVGKTFGTGWKRCPTNERLMEKHDGFMKALKCRECGREYPLTATHVCEFDFGPLEVAYDYDRIKKAMTKAAIATRPETMWRYREL